MKVSFSMLLNEEERVQENMALESENESIKKKSMGQHYL
ncbi:Uncharacterised protein [Streptococcus pneumoniae]|nr:Uncharacterised protein [Streptococcus pneumoniae]CRH98004.1 Uncharacterised protein [Streptococcus pneumoniae]